jgi:hypothetical protein
MMDTGSPSIGLSMIGIVLLITVIACLFNSRTRPFGLVLVVLGVLGMTFFTYQVRQEPATATITVAEVPYQSVQLADEVSVASGSYDAAAAAREAHFKRMAEIVKNQRMAARMDDAAVQQGNDGNWLETYPDGMQIREDYHSRRREIIREADEDLQRSYAMHGGGGASHSSRSEVKLWILGAPLLALAVAFFALRARKRENGFGAPLAILGAAALLLLGFGFVGSRHVSTQSHRVPATPTPAPALIAMAEVQEAQEAVARTHAEMLKQLPVAIPQQSIESMLEKFTAPKINLGSAGEGDGEQAGEAELANAAKVILSASAPGADPFTQGWLLNAARAIMNSASTDKEQVASSEQATATVYPPVQPYRYPDMDGAQEALALDKPGAPRPEWLDVPPTLVGNTQRVVVSSDPFTSVEECYAQLRDKLRTKVHRRIADLAAAASGRHSVYVPDCESLGISIEYILSELCPEKEYIETVSTSVGDMKRAHALVEFTPPQDEFLVDRWRDFARVESVRVVAVLSGLVLVGLAFVYGLIRLDTWTRGYYTKRLFIGVPAAIIAVLALLATV